MAVTLSSIVNSEYFVHELVTSVASEGKTDTTHTDQLLTFLETHLDEFEHSFANGDAVQRGRLLSVLLAASSTRSHVIGLPAPDLLSIAACHRSHADRVVSPPVAVIMEALANVAADDNYPSSIRSAASSSMLSIAVPSAFFQEEGKVSVDGHDYEEGCHNEIPIDRLTRVYSQAINSMITVVVEKSLLRKISASLVDQRGGREEGEDQDNPDQQFFALLADSTMELTRILLQNSTQNYAILRKHLSRDCPEFVPGMILPRLKSIVNVAKKLPVPSSFLLGSNRDWSTIHRSLATVLCLIALLTFKVKAMRGKIAEVDPLGEILKVDGLANHPQVLAGK